MVPEEMRKEIFGCEIGKGTLQTNGLSPENDNCRLSMKNGHRRFEAETLEFCYSLDRRLRTVGRNVRVGNTAVNSS